MITIEDPTKKPGAAPVPSLSNINASPAPVSKTPSLPPLDMPRPGAGPKGLQPLDMPPVGAPRKMAAPGIPYLDMPPPGRPATGPSPTSSSIAQANDRRVERTGGQGLYGTQPAAPGSTAPGGSMLDTIKKGLTYFNRADPVKDAVTTIGGVMADSAKAARGEGDYQSLRDARANSASGTPALPPIINPLTVPKLPPGVKPELEPIFNPHSIARPPQPPKDYGIIDPIKYQRELEKQRFAGPPQERAIGDTGITRYDAPGQTTTYSNTGSADMKGPGVSVLNTSEGMARMQRANDIRADMRQTQMNQSRQGSFLGGASGGIGGGNSVSDQIAALDAQRASEIRSTRPGEITFRNKGYEAARAGLVDQLKDQTANRGIDANAASAARSDAVQMARLGIDYNKAEIEAQEARSRLADAEFLRTAKLDYVNASPGTSAYNEAMRKMIAARGLDAPKRDPYQVATAEELIDPKDPRLGVRRVPYIIDPATGQGRPVVATREVGTVSRVGDRTAIWDGSKWVEQK